MKPFSFFALLTVLFLLPDLALTSEEEFVKLFLGASLDTEIAGANTSASEADLDQGWSLPPPEFTYGRMLMGSGVGENPQSFSIVQRFPSLLSEPYSLRARRASLSKAQMAERASRHRAEARGRYLYKRFALLSQKASTLEGMVQEAKDHIRLNQRFSLSNPLAQVHLNAMSIQRAELENDLETVELQKKQVLKDILSESKSSDLPEELLKKPAYKKSEWTLQAREPIDPKLAELEVEMSSNLVQEARMRWFPDLGLSYGFNEAIMGPNQMTAIPSNHQVMVMVALPFAFPWQVQAQVDKAKATLEASQLRQLKLQRENKELFQFTEEKLKSLERQILRLEQEMLPKALDSKKLIRLISPRDPETLQRHFDVHLKSLEIELKRWDLLIDLEETLYTWNQTTF